MWAIQKGFTVVEILVVILFIAVLAAIAFGSYVGIQKRAELSAASSSLSQTSRNLELYRVDNGAYPALLSDAGIDNDENTNYQYTATDNSYCVTSTVGVTSVFGRDTDFGPILGGCPGHGQNGIAAITNLTRYSIPSSSFGAEGWFIGAGSGGVGTSSWVSSGGPDGHPFVRLTVTTQPAGGTQGVIQGTSTTGSIVTPGETYTLSGWVRVSNTSYIPIVQLRWKNSSSVTISDLNSSVPSSNNGSWYRLSASGIAPAGAAYIEARSVVQTANAPAGTTVDGTGFMVTEGSDVYNFANGDSPSWVWNGSLGSSTSTGPPNLD